MFFPSLGWAVTLMTLVVSSNGAPWSNPLKKVDQLLEEAKAQPNLDGSQVRDILIKHYDSQDPGWRKSRSTIAIVLGAAKDPLEDLLRDSIPLAERCKDGWPHKFRKLYPVSKANSEPLNKALVYMASELENFCIDNIGEVLRDKLEKRDYRSIELIIGNQFDDVNLVQDITFSRLANQFNKIPKGYDVLRALKQNHDAVLKLLKKLGVSTELSLSAAGNLKPETKIMLVGYLIWQKFVRDANVLLQDWLDNKTDKERELIGRLADGSDLGVAYSFKNLVEREVVDMNYVPGPVGDHQEDHIKSTLLDLLEVACEANDDETKALIELISVDVDWKLIVESKLLRKIKVCSTRKKITNPFLH